MFSGAFEVVTQQRACILLGGAAMALSISLVAAQPVPTPSVRPESESQRSGADPEMVVRPTTSGDSKMAEPAPRHIDPGLVERPPADRRPGDRAKPGLDPSARSRQDDCRGSAVDCKQTSAR